MTTPRLAPFPLAGSAAAPLVSDALTGWQLTGDWVATGDAIIVDFYFFGDANQIRIFGQELGFWGSDPETEQDPFNRSGRVSKTYTGLPPNTLVLVRCGVSWNYMDFGAAGKPVGMYVNDVLFAPNTTPSGTGTGNVGQCQGSGRTNASGELTIGFGVENIHPSLDILITFDNIEISTPAAELADVFYDAGVLYIDGSAFSITRGGAAAPFEPNEEIEDYDFPGKRAPVEGCDEVVSSRPTIRVRCMLTGEYQFTVYRPDGTWADHATIDGARVYTLAAMGAALAASKYPHDVIAVWPRQRGDYVGVHFPVALGRRFTMSSADKDEGGLDMEFEARIPAGEPVTTVPYRIVTYAADTPAVG